MKVSWRDPLWVLGIVLLWRLFLFLFTAQPIPANDAFLFDGGVANWLKYGHYVNPCLERAFPISSGQVFSLYPPVYQLALLLWMLPFGFSTLSIMAMHLTMFAAGAVIVILMVRRFFPNDVNYGLAAALLLIITFNDRPEDLAHIFGLVSLWLVANLISRPGPRLSTMVWLILFLLLTLYTSIIVGAVYFGAGFIACGLAGWVQRRRVLVTPYFAVVVLFAAIVFWVMKVHPLWWQGFLENSAKTPAVEGLRKPNLLDLIKLLRAAPVFILAVAMMPFLYARRKELILQEWLFLTAGVFLMGLLTLVLSMTVISPNYVLYTLYLQIILAAGLLALTNRLLPGCAGNIRILILGCVLLVGIRAVGMTTWGVACASKNSYWQTQSVLRKEFAPFTNSEAPVVISSAFLYTATEAGVRHPIHSDWFYDRALTAADADFQGMITLRPVKLVLTQFDYYRGFVTELDKLRVHPELVTFQVRDLAALRPPDAIPSLQRVVQNISWAPVIVDLNWKPRDESGH
ncbi:MAG TPA: hypothetical protein VNZ25_06570 [Candidatus Angelobacter sp.]|jgi:hypothetical protein|nr:hypothetical protein [Candidatus Angelobacter sp.]